MTRYAGHITAENAAKAAAEFLRLTPDMTAADTRTALGELLDAGLLTPDGHGGYWLTIPEKPR